MKNKRIAFVDNEATDLILYGAMLQGMQYNILLVINPATAIKEINEFKPDVIFLDVNLNNEISGFELLEQLRNNNFKGTICMISGYSDANVIKKSIHLGADDYLVKPVYSNSLNNLIENRDGKFERDSNNVS